MFTVYYNMDFNPFNNEIEEKYNFTSNDFIQATAKLDILRQHKGIEVLTGEPGSGKSFCLRCFAHSLSKSLYKVIYIPITTLTVKEFYMALFDGLGITPAYKKVTMFKQIQDSIYGSVLVLFGKTAFGYFACIPDFEAGCHLSHLKDTFWNIEQLVRIIDEVTGITIAEVLRTVADYIGPKAHKED